MGKIRPSRLKSVFPRWVAKRGAGFARCSRGIVSEPRNSTATLVETIVTISNPGVPSAAVCILSRQPTRFFIFIRFRQHFT